MKTGKLWVGIFLPVAATAAAAFPCPAFAAVAAGTGLFSGATVVTPGIPVTGCAATTYVFDTKTSLTGPFVTTGGDFAGILFLQANAGSSDGTTLCPGGGENEVEAAGPLYVTAVDAHGVGTFSCPSGLAGSFHRLGPLFVVTGLRGTCNGVAVTVSAASVLVPTNPGNASESDSTFAGAFTLT